MGGDPEIPEDGEELEDQDLVEEDDEPLEPDDSPEATAEAGLTDEPLEIDEEEP